MHHSKSTALEAATTPEAKLDLIATYLERMDRRDRLRMWGGMLHSLLTIVPMLFFVWSTWYLYAHFDDIMGTVLRQSAQHAATATGQNYEDVWAQIQQALGVQATQPQQ